MARFLRTVVINFHVYSALNSGIIIIWIAEKWGKTPLLVYNSNFISILSIINWFIAAFIQSVKASEGKTRCVNLRSLLYYNVINAQSEEVKAK